MFAGAVSAGVAFAGTEPEVAEFEDTVSDGASAGFVAALADGGAVSSVALAVEAEPEAAAAPEATAGPSLEAAPLADAPLAAGAILLACPVASAASVTLPCAGAGGFSAGPVVAAPEDTPDETTGAAAGAKLAGPTSTEPLGGGASCEIRPSPPPTITTPQIRPLAKFCATPTLLPASLGQSPPDRRWFPLTGIP